MKGEKRKGEKMKKIQSIVYKSINIKVIIISMLLLLYFWAGFSMAFSDGETRKLKIDMKIFNEFYRLMADNFTDAKFEGETKQIVDGALVESKYEAYSKDLDYKRIDVVSYGDKFSHVTTPDMVWFYFEKSNYVIYYSKKENVAKFNSSVYFDSVKEDGKISRTYSDGRIIYRLLDYKYNIKQTYIFDAVTRKLVQQIVEPAGGDKIESTYKGWDKIKVPKDLFSFPSRANSKCLDQSMHLIKKQNRIGNAFYGYSKLNYKN